MEKELRISYIQYDIAWEAPAQNRKYIDSLLSADLQTDLLILPEMFSTGFSMSPTTMYETMEGDTVMWMQALSQRLNALVLGSIIIKEQEKFYNRLLVCFPNGDIQHYDKKHLFGEQYEQQHYDAGNEKLIVSYKGWKILPLICYDLRFPVWSRNTSDYDVLIYIASWPETRTNHWNTLLKARAIENQSYVIGVNRLGEDGLDLSYIGYSQVIAYDGQIVQHAQKDVGIFHCSIDDNHLKYRTKLNFLKDRDMFTMN